MSIYFILGGSASGKSHYLAEKIIKESMEHPERNYLVVVPEQSTLQTQLKYVALHPRKGLLNIDVLSFERLAWRVLSETGEGDRSVLTETGKSLILRSLAAELKNDLAVFGENLKRPGYVNEMKSLISELSQYGVDCGEIEEAINLCRDEGVLCAKLKDIKLLKESFDNFLNEQSSGYMTGEGLLERLGRLSGRSHLLQGTVICFDGFTGFTPVQFNVIREIMKVSGDVYLTATIGEGVDPFKDRGTGSLFHLTTEMCSGIARLAGELNIDIEEPVRIDNENKYKSEDIIYLGRNLFRYDRKVSSKRKPDSIFVHQARNPYEEVRLAASLVEREVRSGLSYGDIGIIVGNQEEYAPVFNDIFKERNIPFFMDMKRSALNNSCVEFVRSAVKLIEDRYSYDSMFRFLKSGFTDIAEQKLFKLENYCLARGISGYKKWHEPWIYPQKDMDEAELEEINMIRSEFMEKLSDFESAMRQKNRTVGSCIKAIYDLMVSFDIEEKVCELSADFESGGRADLSNEYSQIYGIIMELFDQMEMLLRNERISISELSPLLDAGFDEIRVGVIPPGSDQVMVGDLERSRLGQIKTLIVLGFNDGVMPGINEKAAILTDRDKVRLKEKGIKLSPTASEKNFIQRFYLYLALTHPTEKLHICYSNVNSDGSALRPSYYLWELKRVFHGLEVINEVPEEKIRDLDISKREGLIYLAENINDFYEDDTWKELYGYYSDDPEAEKALELIKRGAFDFAGKRSLARKTAEELYQKLKKTSISRLETYSTCPYSYFLKYGLSLQDRDIFSFEATDRGTLLHDALYNYGKMLSDKKLDWTGVSEEDGKMIRKIAFDRAFEKNAVQVLNSTARLKYTAKRLRDAFDITVWALTKQLELGDYKPAAYELDFGRDEKQKLSLPLDNGGSVQLNGKIDRLDIAQKDGKAFVKIMDYKTGSKEFDPSAVYSGLDLQLFSYLDAALGYVREKHPELKEVEPGGVMYYHIKEPKVDVSEKEAEHEILNELKPDGIVNCDDANLVLLDRNFEDPSYKGGTGAAVTRKKDGSFTKASQILSSEDFLLFNSHLKKKMTDMVREISAGNIEVKPVSGIKDGCEYCNFKQICCFDGNIPQCRSRFVRKADMEEIRARLHENEDGCDNL